MSGRGGQIRTDDIRVPNAALYQAELRPVHGRNLFHSPDRIKNFLQNFSFSSRPLLPPLHETIDSAHRAHGSSRYIAATRRWQFILAQCATRRLLHFSLGTWQFLDHFRRTRQGCFATVKPRFSDARERPSEPDAGHAAVGSRNSPQFPFPRPCLIRTAFSISSTPHHRTLALFLP